MAPKALGVLLLFSLAGFHVGLPISALLEESPGRLPVPRSVPRLVGHGGPGPQEPTRDRWGAGPCLRSHPVQGKLCGPWAPGLGSLCPLSWALLTQPSQCCKPLARACGWAESWLVTQAAEERGKSMLIASPLHPQATSHRDKPFIEADLAAGSSHTQGGGDLVIPEASTRLSGGARPAPGFPPPSHAGILFPRLWARAGGHHCSGAAATLSLRDAVGPEAHGGHRTCSRFSAGWERGRKTSRRGRPPQAGSGPAPCVHWASCRCVVRGSPVPPCPTE